MVRKVSSQTLEKRQVIRKKTAPPPPPGDMRVDESNTILTAAISALGEKLDEMPAPIVNTPEVHIPEPVIHIPVPEARRPVPYRCIIHRDADHRMMEVDLIPIEE